MSWRYVYLMPYIPFAYHESYVNNAFDEHLLAIGSLNGLELSRLYLPMVLLRERAPSDGHITTGIDERWYGSSTIFNKDADGTGVLANRADRASIELPFLGIGELRACPEPVSGISTTPTGAFLRRNELRCSLPIRSCRGSW